MRVRMLRHITGTRNGVEWPSAGGQVDLPDHEALDLIAANYAEPVATAELGADQPPGDADTPPEAKVETVLAWVDGRPDAAQVALDHEQAKAKPRKGLVAQLEEIIAQGGTDASTTGDTGGQDDGAPGPDGPPSAAAGPEAASEQADAPGDGEAASSREW